MKERRFSDFEKDVINILLRSPQAQPGLYSLFTIVHNEMCVNGPIADFALKFENNANNVFVIPSSMYVNNTTTDSILAIESNLIQITKLFNYLTNENYIIPIDNYSGRTYTFFLAEKDWSQSQFRVIYDREVAADLFKYLNVNFIITNDLHALVERDFKNVEEIRFQENMRIAWLGVLTAMLTSIITLVITCYSSDVKVERLKREVTKLRNEVNEQPATLQEQEVDDEE